MPSFIATPIPFPYTFPFTFDVADRAVDVGDYAPVLPRLDQHLYPYVFFFLDEPSNLLEVALVPGTWNLDRHPVLPIEYRYYLPYFAQQLSTDVFPANADPPQTTLTRVVLIASASSRVQLLSSASSRVRLL